MDYNKITNENVDVDQMEDTFEPDTFDAEDEPDTFDAEDEPTVETFIGTVSGCKRLNIRKGPSKLDEVIAIVDAGSLLVVVESDEAADDWYKVNVEVAGIEFEGFCMSEFVTID